MVTTNSCATGREMPRTKNQSKYLHMVTCPEIGVTDRPQDRLISVAKHFQHSNVALRSWYCFCLPPIAPRCLKNRKEERIDTRSTRMQDASAFTQSNQTGYKGLFFSGSKRKEVS